MPFVLAATFGSAFSDISRIIRETWLADGSRLLGGRDTLPYHAVLLHWHDSERSRMLPLLDAVRFQPCAVKICTVGMHTYRDGADIRFNAEPDRGFAEMFRTLTEQADPPVRLRSFYPVCISEGSDKELLRQQARRLAAELRLPITVQVSALELYSLSPVRLLRMYLAE